MNCLFAFFGIGHWEILLVAGIILLLFGHRLPSVMRSLGTGITQFKRGLHDDPGDELDEHDETVKEKPKRVVEEK
jgi:sec-independent protein translocase protein TatA